MSTSKGRGAAAHEIVEVIPPEQLRTLFIRPRPNHAIEFEPEGTDAIPRLFDEFDKLAAATAGRETKGDLPPGFASVFRYALRDADADVAAEAAAFRPAFSHLAFLAQVPSRGHPGPDGRGEGECPDGARGGHPRRAPCRRRGRGSRRTRRTGPGWSFASSLPAEAAGLDAEQRAFLGALAGAIRTARTAPAGRPDRAAAMPGRPRSSRPRRASACHRAGAFAALYLSFLGRPNGPRAGWLLAGLDQQFVARRLREAAAGHATINPAGGAA